MPEKKCLLCGNDICGTEEQNLCPACHDITEKRNSLNCLFEDVQKNNTSEDLLENEAVPFVGQATGAESGNDVGEKKPVKPEKPFYRKKKTIVGFIFVILLGMVSGGFIFMDAKNKNRYEEAELSFWYLCIEENTPLVYSQYLMLYPNGRFRNDAHTKISELRNVEREEWESVKQSSELEDFYGFIRKYPATPFRNEIYKITDSLSWLIALNENTPDAYKLYIENAELGNISGYYEGIARTRFNYLSNIRVIEGDDLEKIRDVIGVFFKTLSDADFDTLNDLMDKNVSNFYGVRQRNASVILSSIASDMEKNNIRKLQYDPDLETLKAYQDGNGLYSMEISVLKTIDYTNKKSTDKISEKIYTELTPDLKVKSLYAKK